MAPEGIAFKVEYKGKIVPVRIEGAFGRQSVYAVLSALSAGVLLGMNLVEIVEVASQYAPPPGRLRLLKGVKNTYILDDTYNSSPAALEAALEVLRELPAKRKIAVLGDMLELGEYTIDEHKKAGKRAAAAADVIFTVGPRAKFMAEGARESGFPSERIFSFSDSNEAKKEVQSNLEEGDLVLVKGSQAMRMERIVEEIMAEPDKKEILLARQEKEWHNR